MATIARAFLIGSATVTLSFVATLCFLPTSSPLLFPHRFPLQRRRRATSTLSAQPTDSGSVPIVTSGDDGFVPLQPHRRRFPAGRYVCEVCAKRFDKLKQYEAHLASRGHRAVLAEEGEVWDAYVQSGDIFFHPDVERSVATRRWNIDAFLDGLPGRTRSSVGRVLGGGGPMSDEGAGGQICPSLMLSDLPPPKRAALWRFLRDVSPLLASMVSVLPPRYARVKELLESAEVFIHVERLIRRAQRGGQRRFTDVYDVGCGHGLVAMIVAAEYPGMRVHAVDIEPRESFMAQKMAFAKGGTDLNNLTFEAGDLSSLELIAESRSNGIGTQNIRSLLLCVHGCKSLTHESIELASRYGWAWLAVPCCLQVENHLAPSAKVQLPDKTRFMILCGALAMKYGAENVEGIDSRVTARGIVISSSGGSEDNQGRM